MLWTIFTDTILQLHAWYNSILLNISINCDSCWGLCYVILGKCPGLGTTSNHFAGILPQLLYMQLVKSTFFTQNSIAFIDNVLFYSFSYTFRAVTELIDCCATGRY